MRILITGATGYVGGRLVPRLLAAGHVVRCMVRDPSRLQGRAWINQVDTVAGDVLDDKTVASALAGIDVAYYLVHSMGSGHDFHVRDARAARAFGEAATGRRCAAPGLPRRAGRSRYRPVRAPAIPAADRRRAPRGRGAGHRVPRRGDRRRRLAVVRDDPLPDGAGADHDLPELGLHPHPADRDQERAGLPGHHARRARECRTGDRDRRRQRHHLRRDDDRLRAAARPAAPAGAGARADAAPQLLLGAPGDADSRDHRPAADRGPAQRSRGAGPPGGSALPRCSPDGLRRGGVGRTGAPGRRGRGNRPGATRSPAARAMCRRW